ncbi:MAG: Flp pilus assembly protein CpaB [Marmoricola sp.]|nr:Flp pilus assembly protein CpaB [Marmoricola sp.]
MDRRKVLLLVAAVIAALGTLVVFLYVRGANNRADQRYAAVTVLKAVKQIDPGETALAAQQAGKLTTASVSRQDVLAGAINGLDPINNEVATTTIYPGEQIVTSKFGAAGSAGTTALTIPKGDMAISVSLSDPSRVAGFVNPGDKVSIFYSSTSSGNGNTPGGAFTRLLLPNVQVIGVGTTTVTPKTTTAADGTQSTEQLPRTLLTLSVSQAEAQKVIFASNTGTLAFGLLNGDSQVAPSKGVTNTNLFN